MNVDAERYPALAALAMNTEETTLGVHVGPEMVSELDDLDEFTRRATNDPLLITAALLVIRARAKRRA